MGCEESLIPDQKESVQKKNVHAMASEEGKREKDDSKYTSAQYTQRADYRNNEKRNNEMLRNMKAAIIGKEKKKRIEGQAYNRILFPSKTLKRIRGNSHHTENERRQPTLKSPGKQG